MKNKTEYQMPLEYVLWIYEYNTSTETYTQWWMSLLRTQRGI